LSLDQPHDKSAIYAKSRRILYSGQLASRSMGSQAARQIAYGTVDGDGSIPVGNQVYFVVHLIWDYIKLRRRRSTILAHRILSLHVSRPCSFG